MYIPLLGITITGGRNKKPVEPKNSYKGERSKTKQEVDKTSIPPGRVSKPEDAWGNNYFSNLQNSKQFVKPGYKNEIVPLIRALYKVNPDIGIALQDMFKLANSGHDISFPYNTPEEATKMRKHLADKSIEWGRYTYGIDGLINKAIIQCLIGGAVSIEAIPSDTLDTVENIVFIKPETIVFTRDAKGGYHPYQNVTGRIEPIKLNTKTYFYCAMFSDVDEPHGVPPFMPALDSLDGQAIMKGNFKNIMEMYGLLGFLEATIAKPGMKGGEGDAAYQARLTSVLRQTKEALLDGMSEGVVVGFDGDHEFKLNATNKSIGDIEKPWNMNQQSVANGLGVSSNIIGISNANTEGGAGIMLSKLISQLRTIQIIAAHILTKIYTLELLLAGYNNKGVSIKFNASTVSDEYKVQQGLEIKVRNAIALYNQGIYGQEDVGRAFGIEKPSKKKPRIVDADGMGDAAAKAKKEADKGASERKGADKKKIVPKRNDQDSKKR